MTCIGCTWWLVNSEKLDLCCWVWKCIYIEQWFISTTMTSIQLLAPSWRAKYSIGLQRRPHTDDSGCPQCALAKPLQHGPHSKSHSHHHSVALQPSSSHSQPPILLARGLAGRGSDMSSPTRSIKRVQFAALPRRPLGRPPPATLGWRVRIPSGRSSTSSSDSSSCCSDPERQTLPKTGTNNNHKTRIRSAPPQNYLGREYSYQPEQHRIFLNQLRMTLSRPSIEARRRRELLMKPPSAPPIIIEEIESDSPSLPLQSPGSGRPPPPCNSCNSVCTVSSNGSKHPNPMKKASRTPACTSYSVISVE